MPGVVDAGGSCTARITPSVGHRATVAPARGEGADSGTRSRGLGIRASGEAVARTEG